MKADVISAIARGHLVAIWDEESVRFCREVVVSCMQEDGKAMRPWADILSGNGFTISTNIVSFAARRRISPAALRLMGLGSN
ncbi:hypothetical protein A6U87_21135 [Rhizobium sp. AC44/96]|nr:hypothetical protein A6U87_21135 [Rhizobium sp. AC44/96]